MAGVGWEWTNKDTKKSLGNRFALNLTLLTHLRKNILGSIELTFT